MTEEEEEEGGWMQIDQSAPHTEMRGKSGSSFLRFCVALRAPMP